LNLSERETVVELPFAADCCPCVEKLRTVLPSTDEGVRAASSTALTSLNRTRSNGRRGKQWIGKKQRELIRTRGREQLRRGTALASPHRTRG
jgi:hypothetical protein